MAAYFIIGGDGKEYGPVPAAELRQWVQDKRVNAQTRMRAETSTDWTTAGQIPEVAAMFSATPPPLPAAPVAESRLSGLAVTSLVLGVLGLACGLTALPGLIIGIIALVKISKSRGALRGHGLALAGTIVSGVLLLFIPIMAAMLLPALSAAKNKAQAISCLNNEKQLSLAVRMYSLDHTNRYPTAATWCDDIQTAVGMDKVFKCPAAESLRCGYAYNAKLDGVDESSVNPQTVMIFESDQGWNASGGPELAAESRHGRGAAKMMNVAFADGHVERVTADRLATLRWEP